MTIVFVCSLFFCLFLLVSFHSLFVFCLRLLISSQCWIVGIIVAVVVYLCCCCCCWCSWYFCTCCRGSRNSRCGWRFCVASRTRWCSIEINNWGSECWTLYIKSTHHTLLLYIFWSLKFTLTSFYKNTGKVWKCSKIYSKN